MNKNGFTLIELIATIAILGIVSLMSFPSINNAINSNKTSSCKNYEKLIIVAAKSYIQKESFDLLENSSSVNLLLNGGYEITISNLISTGYLDNYSDSKTRIKDGATVVVKAKAINDYSYSYTYTPHFVCTDTSGRTIYSK